MTLRQMLLLNLTFNEHFHFPISMGLHCVKAVNSLPIPLVASTSVLPKGPRIVRHTLCNTYSRQASFICDAVNLFCSHSILFDKQANYVVERETAQSHACHLSRLISFYCIQQSSVPFLFSFKAFWREMKSKSKLPKTLYNFRFSLSS